jgi:gas vesicle protein
MSNNSDHNALVYLLAGFGLGALLGALAGLLLAPKAGTETREELASRLKELKSKSEEWIAEQKVKKNTAALEASDEVGA